jgi:transposase
MARLGVAQSVKPPMAHRLAGSDDDGHGHRSHQLQHMDAQQLRALAEGLMAKLMDKDQEIHFKQTKIDLLTHEIARYKRLQFAAKSEKLQADQRSLLDETLDADLAALEAELQALSPAPAEPADTPSKAKPRRARHCPHTCRAWRSATSPRARNAAAAAR